MTVQHLYIPILPLPNVVFFPHSLLPLHVFEPRYRAMIAACLKGDRLMGVPLLKPGWEKEYYGSPPIYPVFGMGKIIEHERLDNGSYNIWLSGIDRVRLIMEARRRPFRVAKIVTLPDTYHPSVMSEVAEARRDLVEAAQRLARRLPELGPRVRKGVDEHIYPGALADFLAGLLCDDMYAKQCILAEADLKRRLRLTMVQVRARLREAAQRQHLPRPTTD